MFSKDNLAGLAVVFLLTVMVYCLNCGEAVAGCFRGKPLPDCRSFWITESSILYRFDNGGFGEWHQRLYYLAELGTMYNVNRTTAVGWSASLGFDDLVNDTRFYIGGRYRRWYSRRIATDVGLSLLVSGSKSTSPGLAANASVLVNEDGGLSVRMEWLKHEATSTSAVAWYGGIKFASEAGIIVAVGGTLIALLILSKSDDNNGYGDLRWF